MNQARRDFAAKLLSQPAVCLAEVYRKRGDVLDLTGFYDTACDEYNRAKTLFHQAGCRSKCGEVEHAVGNLMLNRGAFDKAEVHFKKALDVFSEFKDEINVAKCYKEMGKLCQYREKPDEALTYYQKSLIINKQLGDIKGCDVIVEYQADVYRSKGEYKKALEAVTQLLDQYKDSNEFRTFCRILKLAGYIYMDNGNNELSKVYLEKAYQYSIKTGESSMAMYILCDLGASYYSTGEYETACMYYGQCLDMAEKLDSTYMKAVNLVNLADAFSKKGDLNRSRACINRAATINHNIGGLTSEIQRIQEEIAQKEGDQEKAGQEKSRETQGDQVPHAT